MRRTGRLLTRLRQREVRAGIRQATAGLPWVLRERRPVPRQLESQLQLLN